MLLTRFRGKDLFVALSLGGLRVAFVAERLRRYVQVVVTFGGVGSSPTECNTFFLPTYVDSRAVSPGLFEISVVGANGPYICPVLSNHSAFAGQLSVP